MAGGGPKKHHSRSKSISAAAANPPTHAPSLMERKKKRIFCRSEASNPGAKRLRMRNCHGEIASTTKVFPDRKDRHSGADGYLSQILAKTPGRQTGGGLVRFSLKKVMSGRHFRTPPPKQVFRPEGGTKTQAQNERVCPRS